MSDEFKLINELKEIINNKYQKEIEVENYPEQKELVELINTIIRETRNLKASNIKFKSILEEDLNQLEMILEKTASGDFDSKMPDIKLLELGNVVIGIDNMRKSLKKLLKREEELIQLKKIIEEILSSSTEIATTNEEITVKANDEIKIVSEASSSVTELAASIKQVASNSEKVSSKANESVLVVKDEYKHIIEAISKIIETNKITKESSENLIRLNKSAQQIQDILEIINKISERIDLLALNAAIEASGAGEAGRRFRVVADEMRRLADTSLKSTKNITEILTTIQNEINKNTEIMTENANLMESVTKEMEKIGETMKKIVTVFEETAQLTKEVSLVTNQQAGATEMLTNIIYQINISAEETLKAIENSKSVIGKFIEISNNLKEIVARLEV